MKKTDMQANDHSSTARFFSDLKTCLAFLTRFPVKGVDQNRQLCDTAHLFAVVGIIVGAIQGVIFWVSSLIGLPILVGIIFALVAGVVVTGALHEDGLADFADSFGGWNRDRKLEIMRDSRIGTYGVLALILAVAVKTAALTDILAHGQGLLTDILVFAGIGALSRSSIALMMYRLALARADGAAADAGKPASSTVTSGLLLAITLGGGFVFVSNGLQGFVLALLAVAVSYVVMRNLINQSLGGYSGDALGALQQITEIACLLALVLAG
jgi:adenosylcobinamide-GDP ribazoletransferase